MAKEDNSNDDYVFYKERNQWKDVTPVPQDDGDFPIVRIAYSKKFEDVYDYLRAMLQADERSDRAFDLTTDAANLNSANYTVWQYRRVLLRALNKDLKDELDYVSNMIRDHPKNYQVWHHRKCVVEWLGDPSQELEFVADILEDDAKNYHAWQHRQWVLITFSLWDGELDYVHELLNNDLRNNSAWNQRFYVIYHTSGFTEEVKAKEVTYAKDFIKKAPNNESSWNYLRGVLLEGSMSAFPGVEAFCEALYSNNIRSPHLLGFMIDCIEERLDDKSQDCDRPKLLQRATEMCRLLADEIDTIRVEYWRYIERSLNSRYGKTLQSGDAVL